MRKQKAEQKWTGVMWAINFGGEPRGATVYTAGPWRLCADYRELPEQVLKENGATDLERSCRRVRVTIEPVRARARRAK